VIEVSRSTFPDRRFRVKVSAVGVIALYVELNQRAGDLSRNAPA
jgi:hypothetical protein